MFNTANKILLANNFVTAESSKGGKKADLVSIATVFFNLVHYGFTPSKELIETVSNYTEKELILFWYETEKDLKELSFEDREMDKFVVYRNFPDEVLEKTAAEYWYAQISMYAGYSYEFFQEDVIERPKLTDVKNLKVLKVANSMTLANISESLKVSKTRWNDMQVSMAQTLLDLNPTHVVEMSDFGFKENGINLIKKCIIEKREFSIKDATDVMRLAAAISEGDISLRTNVRFKKFNRTERKMFLGLLENSKNMESDMAMRQSQWKKFMFQLHPGDYKFAKVKDAYGKLCRGELKSFNAIIENSMREGDEKALQLISTRSGEILRRFHKLYEIFDEKAVNVLVAGIKDFDTLQLLKLKKYITSINSRTSLIYAPNGNWSKAQFADVKEKAKSEFKPQNKKEEPIEQKIVEVAVVEETVKELVNDGSPSVAALLLLKDKLEGKIPPVIQPLVKPVEKVVFQKKEPVKVVAEKVKIDENSINVILQAINVELESRLREKFENGVDLDENTKKIKLQNNDQTLAVNYGRGTSFDIPEDVTFIRSGSYWQMGQYGNVWFDNGWNFFDADWKNKGVCCWNAHNLSDAAVFSGDPVISQTEGHKGCQMIDLYLDKLAEKGVRYAVWNLLSYNGINFDDAEDVIATIQMGDQANAGRIYEPSRAQMAFEVKGKNLAKYIAYVDIVERKVVFMDANLRANVSTAVANSLNLERMMPAFVEYLDTLPSVYDLFESVKGGTTPVMYSDKDVKIETEKAFVFNHVNSDNEFENIDINELLKK
jgi:hypothetical protein